MVIIDNMSCGIYKITNNLNNKCYIGQSLIIEERWKEHKRNAWNKITPLYKAIRKYGLKNFTFSIIEECDSELLNDREKYWISYYNSFNNGYNNNKGGNCYRKNYKPPKQIINN